MVAVAAYVGVRLKTPHNTLRRSATASVSLVFIPLPPPPCLCVCLSPTLRSTSSETTNIHGGDGLASAWCRCRQEALEYFKRIRSLGAYPPWPMCSLLVQLLASEGMLEEADEQFADVLAHGVLPTESCATMMIRLRVQVWYRYVSFRKSASCRVTFIGRVCVVDVYNASSSG